MNLKVMDIAMFLDISRKNSDWHKEDMVTLTEHKERLNRSV